MMWVVVCTSFNFEDGILQGHVVTGPWPERKGADQFALDSYKQGDIAWVGELVKPPKPPSIHPNQAQIGDYIDPVVAN